VRILGAARARAVAAASTVAATHAAKCGDCAASASRDDLHRARDTSRAVVFDRKSADIRKISQKSICQEFTNFALFTPYLTAQIS